MVITYLSLYLFFIIVVSLIISFLVLALKLPSPRLIITIVIIFILSPLIFGYFYLIYFESLPEMTVPDVTGLPLPAAREKIETLGLKAREAGKVFEAKHPEGAVVSQRPEGGRRVKAGRVVNLMVSSGKRKVPVPSLVGRPLAQADEILSAAELRVGDIRFEQNNNPAEGTILAQEPLAGEETAAGDPVDLLVSTTLEVIVEESTEEVE
jgi:serine/threonine-protein kinase